MIITGVVIDVDPGCGTRALTGLQSSPGVVWVEGTISPGRLVAVVEAADNASLDVLMADMLNTPGIVGVNPAFIHFDA
ncbi:MAG TPA: chaperone NapD [Symbiobacteriaceae bacterium]|nr:chaperone NapD [Symbiobacteriaceae bacterium]